MLRAFTEGTGNITGRAFTGTSCAAAVAVDTEATGALAGSRAGRAIRQRGLALAVDAEGTGAAVRIAATLGTALIT